MRLSRLEMLGFKSFMGKTVLNFESGITAVLGPNGCGKSNIVDAIRWVLGEQSAKLLRGVKMENVIFDGTKRRPPMGFAEVTLTFTGASERLPVEWDEISIKRRVTRAGGSEYFLNNQPYRLHEIKDLLAGTGLGNHVYSIIELGMVKDILSEAGDKRRLLFEEASGIMRYKLRRKESLAKLGATEGDLTRLDDILDELGKSVRSLKYQVGRARSYQRLQDELKAAERQHAAEQLHAQWQRQRALRRDLESAGDAGRAQEGKLAALEASLSAAQAELLAQEEEYKRRRDALELATDAYRKREEELAVLDERVRAEERQAAQMEQEARMAAEAITRLEADRETLETERTELEAIAQRLETELAEADEAHAALDAQFAERRTLLTREKQLPNVAFRGVNEAYVASEGKHERISEPLVICGGDIDVDKFIVQTQGAGIRASHASLKIKAIAHQFALKFIKGDQSTDPREFNGLQIRCTGSQLVSNGSTSGGDPLSLAKLDELIDLPDEPGHQALCDAEQAWIVEAIRNDTDLSRHMSDAVQSLRICLAADESIRSGKTIFLGETK